MLKDIFSENIEVATNAIAKAIEADRNAEAKTKARQGLKYYKGDHDILDYKLYYFDSNGRLHEELNRSNIKIPHMYHTELVDQKVQYLLSNPVEITTDDEQFQAALDEYTNEKFQEVLQDALEGAANKGTEYVYAYLTQEGKLGFQAADSLGVIPVQDETDSNNLIGILRYYTTTVQDAKGNDVPITKAEVWTDKNTTYYTQTAKAKVYRLDSGVSPNPMPHILMADDKQLYDGGGLGYIPFFKLQNNKYESTDLEPIKDLIDDYDLMACSLSNNLQDFQDAIYVVKGYPGDNLDELATNLKTKKIIGLDEEGGIDVKTVEIPVAARETKLRLDREAIYKFGMGVDSLNVGDGNVTNVVIKSRYALLDLKCNKAEGRLRTLIRSLLKAIVEDINRRTGKAYDYTSPKIKINREMMVNEDSLVANAKVEAETLGKKIENVLLASMISEETKLRLVCELLELDFEEEQAKLLEEGPYTVDGNLVDQLAGGAEE